MYALNVPSDSINYPLFIPAADYRLDLRIFNEKNLTVMFHKGFFSVEPKGIINC